MKACHHYCVQSWIKALAQLRPSQLQTTSVLSSTGKAPKHYSVPLAMTAFKTITVSDSVNALIQNASHGVVQDIFL